MRIAYRNHHASRCNRLHLPPVCRPGAPSREVPPHAPRPSPGAYLTSYAQLTASPRNCPHTPHLTCRQGSPSVTSVTSVNRLHRLHRLHWLHRLHRLLHLQARLATRLPKSSPRRQPPAPPPRLPTPKREGCGSRSRRAVARVAPSGHQDAPLAAAVGVVAVPTVVLWRTAVAVPLAVAVRAVLLLPASEEAG